MGSSKAAVEVTVEVRHRYNLWNRYINGEQLAVSQVIYRLENVIATKARGPEARSAHECPSLLR